MSPMLAKYARVDGRKAYDAVASEEGSDVVRMRN